MKASKKIVVNCVICGEEFETYPSLVERGSAKCCSIECSNVLKSQRMRARAEQKKSAKLTEDEKYSRAIQLWINTPDIWDKCMSQTCR